MVSNEEITKRLKNRREGKVINGYLVCNKCGGYYELQPGESSDDFDTECECGGQLVQSAINSLPPSGEEYLLDDEYEEKYNTVIAVAYVFLVLFAPLAFLMSLYLITRDHKWAKHDGKIIFAISLVIMFLYVIAGAFLIPLKYAH
ncbi:hypothetical protein [Methanobacterium sp.]|jgi:hypothetical protein|uniref:hypothetical protein n=1 Tax=Methanobacterium sp. TaxID=2164 RepID=UPI0031591AC3